MSFSKQLAVLVVSVAALVAASPIAEVEARAENIFPRADSVTVCHNDNYGSPCIYAPNSNGQCHNVGSLDNDKISSIRLGPNTNCIFWTNFGCTGSALFVNSDKPTLHNEGFNDVISSFLCYGFVVGEPASGSVLSACLGDMFNGAFPRSSVLILGAQQIHALLPSTLISQVESLLAAHRIQDAIDLADQRRRKLQESITLDEDEADELRYAYQRIGFQCLRETMFEDAGNNFLNGDLDPRLLVSYYPELRGSLFGSEDSLDVFSGVAEHMPEEASVDDIIMNYSPHLAPNTRSAPPTVELRKILNMTARDMLTSFLRKCRTKRITDEESGILTKEAVNVVVDTVLARLYALDGRRSDLHDLLQSQNYVKFEEIEKLLEEQTLYSALCIMYKARNDVSKLLSVWSRLVDGTIHDDNIKDPLGQMLTLISEKRERSLIQQWGVWLSKKHPDQGLELLKSLHAGKRRDRPEEDLATLQRLKDVNSVAAAQYLEHLILVRGNNTPTFHDEFATTCVNQLISLLSNDTVSKLWRAKAASYASSTRNETTFLSYFTSTTPESDHKRIRLKTITFLQASTFYDPLPIKELLDPHIKLLPLELAILEGKLGNHRSALHILAHNMRDDLSAEAYCALGGQVVPPKLLRSVAEKAGILQWNVVQPLPASQISRQNTSIGSEIKGNLLKLLLEVYMSDEAGPANRAARLLNAQASSLDVVDVISLIPPRWPLNTMSSFLTRSFRRTLHDVHEGQIIKMISLAQNLEVKDSTWGILREAGAMVEEAADDESSSSFDEKSSLSEKVALRFDAMNEPQTTDIHVDHDPSRT
ncbi:hypothetical protein ONZ45_g15430 [Pleurotus djamor]|nr:hypothetical protein ONZ45_g15430 [Pleurotus djamor]